MWWEATWRLASVDHVNCEYEYDYKGHNPDQQQYCSGVRSLPRFDNAASVYNSGFNLRFCEAQFRDSVCQHSSRVQRSGQTLQSLARRPYHFVMSLALTVRKRFADMELYNVINSDSQFNMNCTKFTEGNWKSLNLVRAIASVLGTVIILAILLFLIHYKVYSSLLQRLYVYLIIATLLCEITGVINIEHQWRYKGQKVVCEGTGLFYAWTSVLLFILSAEIIVYLLYLVVSNIGGTRLTQCGTGCTRCCCVIVEMIYVAIPVLISTVFALPPLFQRKYGIAGPWCFVRSLNDDCKPTGFTAQMAFYAMYMTLGVAGIVASLIFSAVYFKLSSSFREVRHLLKRTLYLLAFDFIHILTILGSFACRIYTLKTCRHQLYGLWLTHALSYPIGVLVFPVGYFLCFHPVGKIAQNVYKKMAIKCCRYSKSFNHVEVPSITGIRRATAPRSDRLSQPSITFFVVPHPDALSEKSSLLSDAGYGSTSQPHSTLNYGT